MPAIGMYIIYKMYIVDRCIVDVSYATLQRVKRRHTDDSRFRSVSSRWLATGSQAPNILWGIAEPPKMQRDWKQFFQHRQLEPCIFCAADAAAATALVRVSIYRCVYTYVVVSRFLVNVQREPTVMPPNNRHTIHTYKHICCYTPKNNAQTHTHTPSSLACSQSSPSPPSSSARPSPHHRFNTTPHHATHIIIFVWKM